MILKQEQSVGKRTDLQQFEIQNKITKIRNNKTHGVKVTTVHYIERPKYQF